MLVADRRSRLALIDAVRLGRQTAPVPSPRRAFSRPGHNQGGWSWPDVHMDAPRPGRLSAHDEPTRPRRAPGRRVEVGQVVGPRRRRTDDRGGVTTRPGLAGSPRLAPPAGAAMSWAGCNAEPNLCGLVGGDHAAMAVPQGQPARGES